MNAFHHELNIYLSAATEIQDEKEFIKNHEHIYNEFSKELLKLGTGLISFGIGVWLTTNAPVSNDLEIAKKFFEGSAYLISGLSISSSWKHTKTDRYCNKYLADLKKHLK